MTTQSFSGVDFSVMFVLDGINILSANTQPRKLLAELQTITISSTTSVHPVRQLGHRKVQSYVKGARTFAGTMIFTVLDKDPFQEIFAFDALENAVRSDGQWHIDMMPPFDIIISCVNEAGRAGVQIIQGVTLTNTGTTYSVDDIYTESTYTYVAEHVTPFVGNPVYDKFLKLVKKHVAAQKTADDLLADQLQKNKISSEKRMQSLIQELFDGDLQGIPGMTYVAPNSFSVDYFGLTITDPVLKSLLSDITSVSIDPELNPSIDKSFFSDPYYLDDFYNLKQ